MPFSPFAKVRRSIQNSKPQSQPDSAPPLVIAHRGASRIAPENTLAAFSAAGLAGADGIEMDVHLSADGFPVVIHDKRVERTTNGSGQVARLTVAQLSSLDAGSWFWRRLLAKPRVRAAALQHFGSPRELRSVLANQSIPTLKTALELLAGANYRRIYVEIKGARATRNQLVAATITTVRDAGLASTVRILSFHREAIAYSHALAPDIKSALTVSGLKRPLSITRSIIDAAGRAGAGEVALHYTLVSPRLIRALAASGVGAGAWTVNRKATMKRMMDCGVDFIITNDVRRLESVLAERLGQHEESADRYRGNDRTF